MAPLWPACLPPLQVVSYRYTKGIEGFGVYQYLLRRRPGQGKLLSQVGTC